MSINSKLADLEALESKLLSIECDINSVALDLYAEIKSKTMDYWIRLLDRMGIEGEPTCVEVDKENPLDIRVILYDADYLEIAELVTEEIASFGDDND